ncbi:glycosyltransferase family protein [Lutimonas sp.]|uniref:glycosyltransferase family protein n=1 Tax=Lutimonas sp. TaxID=1872403 RepID=UPI003C746BD6
MKIFYAVQATGNGHISRANQIVPILKKYGEVDLLLSGNNYSLKPEFEVKYRSKGISLYYNDCGSVNLGKTIFSKAIFGAIKDARSLTLKDYDIVINDFDFVTSVACSLQKVPSVHFGHQASFRSKNVPRPSKIDPVGELILQHYARAPHHVGLHFKSYDEGIFAPIVKENVSSSKPSTGDYYSIYLPSVDQFCMYQSLKKLNKIKFHWFTHDTKEARQDENIKIMPISDVGFTESLINCKGLITGGGFETPSEALFLGKKLLSVPIKKHYEQQCNSAALKQMGVKILLDPKFDAFDRHIINWIEEDAEVPPLEKADTQNMVEYIVKQRYK